MLAQYRTGYVAFVVGLLVYLLLGRKWVPAGFVLMTVVGVIALGPASLVGEVEPYALRGQTPEEARELSSRLDYLGRGHPGLAGVAADRERVVDGYALRGPGSTGVDSTQQASIAPGSRRSWEQA